MSHHTRMRPGAWSTVVTVLALMMPDRALAQAASPATAIAPPDTGVVTFESSGASQSIAMTPIAVEPTAALPPNGFVCRTPCSMTVPVGSYEVNATTTPDENGPAVRRVVMVSPGTMTVRITPARSRGLAIGLIATGTGLAVGGLAFLVAGLNFALIRTNAGSFDATPLFVVGITGMVVGFAAMIPGFVLMQRAHGGIDERQARRRTLRWLGVGLAPMRDGASIETAFRF